MCDTRVCNECKNAKPITQFRTTLSRHGTKLYIYGYCDDCRLRKAREYQKSPSGRRRRLRYSLKKAYGMTEKLYQSLLISQNGVCAICRQPETKKRQDGGTYALVVDHDHNSGVVRGLLCSKCNTGIGLLGDDPLRLRAAADYLERRRG